MTAQQQDRKWYAIKVFFNKVFQMEGTLLDMGLETYLAADKVQLEGKQHMAAARALASVPENHRPDSRYIRTGPLIFERKPLIPSLIFVKASPEEILAVDARLQGQFRLTGRAMGFIYKSADRESFATIPADQMESFRLITMKGAEGLEFFSKGTLLHFYEGDKVRVTEGPLKGVEGYIKRIRKNRRLLVCMEGIVAVASSYIPPSMLEKVKKEE